MNVKNFMVKLREQEYKVTPQRIAILEAIITAQNYPTVDQIYQQVASKYPAINLATIYHTLHLMTELGLLQELKFSNIGSRYDPNTSPHANIICLKCGEIYDYNSESIRNLWSEIISELLTKPIAQRLDLYVVCNKCAEITSKENTNKLKITFKA